MRNLAGILASRFKYGLVDFVKAKTSVLIVAEYRYGMYRERPKKTAECADRCTLNFLGVVR